ncbi:hypothetical protein HDV05_001170 [Chytridiales sp. JEL 0842]|nr:hypothetical protein HDV05_001170 [Chytridiales sp. JEL 0842]
MSSDKDFLVIGSGTFGLSAAYELRLRGYNVTVFDRLPVPAEDAASNDINKVVRPDYQNDVLYQLYQQLGLESIEVFKEWNKEAIKRYGRLIYYECGAAYMTRTSEMNQFEVDSINQLKKTTTGGKLVLFKDPREASNRWTTLAQPSNAFPYGYANLGAGYADSGLAITYLVQLAKSAGVNFITGPEKGHFSSYITDLQNIVIGITTQDGAKHYGKVLVAAGSWTPSIVPELEGLCVASGQPVVQFKIPAEIRPKYESYNFPVFFADVSKTGYYGFPVNYQGLLKVANHGPGYISPARGGFHDPKTNVGRVTPPSIPREALLGMRRFLQEFMPELNELDIYKTRLCWYCESWDTNFFVDKVPGKEGLFVATGGSGHAFKFTPTIGRVIADIIEDVPSPYRDLFKWRTKPKEVGHITDSIRPNLKPKMLAEVLLADEDDLKAWTFWSGLLEVKVKRGSVAPSGLVRYGSPQQLSEWHFGLTTSAPGVLRFTVKMSPFVTPRLMHEGIEEQVVSMTVVWFAGLVSSWKVTATPQAQYAVAADPTTFVTNIVPDSSLIEIGTFALGTTSSSSLIAVSQNGFQMFDVFTLPTEAADSDVCGQGGPYLLQAAAYSQSLLAHTINGLMELNSTAVQAETGTKLKTVLPNCLKSVHFPTQAPSFNNSACQLTTALGGGVENGRAWTLKPASVFELSIGDFCLGFGGKLGDSLQDFAVFDIDGWGLQDCFMELDCAITSYTRIYSDSTYTTGTTIPISLTNMSYLRAPSKELLIWGNALFYSPNDGQSIFLVYYFGSGITITDCASSNDGYFACSTSDNQIWVGHGATTQFVPVRRARPGAVGAATFAYKPKFDSEGVLSEMVVKQENGIFSTSRVPIDMQAIFDFTQVAQQVSCPYQRISFSAPKDQEAVRNGDGRVYSDDVALPGSVFLDNHRSYTFTVVMTPNSGVKPEDLSLSLQLSGTSYIAVTYKKSIDNVDDVQYEVTITDKGKMSQGLPGTNFGVTRLRISPAGSTFVCKSSGYKTTVAHDMLIYSGCPPFKRVFFSGTTSTCPDSNDAFPCFYYDDSIPLQFSVRDDLLGSTSIYNDTYTVRAIAGGRYPADIKTFSADQLKAFNPNASVSSQTPAWGVQTLTDGIPVFDADNTGILWVCTAGSPCYGISPDGRSSTADYYFIMEMTTENVEMNSYCIFKTNFPVRVYGLPVEIGTTIWATVATALIGLALLFLVLFVQWRAEQRVSMKIAPEDIFGHSTVSVDKPVNRGVSMKKVHPETNASSKSLARTHQLGTPLKSKESQSREKFIEEHWKGSLELLAAQNARNQSKKSS